MLLTGKQLNQGFLLVIATEYLCHKWPGICFVCRNHNPVRSPFLTYHRVFNKNNTTGPLLEQTTAYLLDCPGSPQLLGGSCVLCIVDRCLSFFFPPLCCSCSTSGTLRFTLVTNPATTHDIQKCVHWICYWELILKVLKFAILSIAKTSWNSITCTS